MKLFCFLLTHFNSFSNKYLFFKFIGKCQKEMLSCTPPFSRAWFYFHAVTNSGKLQANLIIFGGMVNNGHGQK